MEGQYYTYRPNSMVSSTRLGRTNSSRGRMRPAGHGLDNPDLNKSSYTNKKTYKQTKRNYTNISTCKYTILYVPAKVKRSMTGLC